MKVLLFNGSPRANGCTYTGLKAIADELVDNGIDAEIFQVGEGDIDDAVKAAAEKCKTADGFVIGSPVYYAAATGIITYFLDKLFGMARADLEYKPGAAISSCRRAGGSATLDQLYKYFGISNMPIVSSNYWNTIHGNTPEEVLKDEEGMQTLRGLGKNMAWMLKNIECGKKNGIEIPKPEDKIKTNFIR